MSFEATAAEQMAQLEAALVRQQSLLDLVDADPLFAALCGSTVRSAVPNHPRPDTEKVDAPRH